jgi:hypothetical protein
MLRAVVCRTSVRLVYYILFYYSVRVEMHSELCGFYGHDTTATVSGSRQSGSCNQTVSTAPSFSGGVRIQYRLLYVQDGSERVILHGWCCNGSKAAATRRPSSDSRLYVVQAFHYEITLELGRMCASRGASHRVHDIDLDAKLVQVLSQDSWQGVDRFPRTDKQDFWRTRKEQR